LAGLFLAHKHAIRGSAFLQSVVLSKYARLLILIREISMKKFLALISMVAFSGLAIAQSATGVEASGGAAGGTASGGAAAGGSAAGAGAAGAGAAAAGGLGVAGALGVAAAIGVAAAVANDDDAPVSVSVSASR
jgi:hypothetical protein